MHSSRMRTGHSLTIWRSLLPGGGGCLLRGGCLLPGSVCSLGGCLLPGGGCLLRGGCLLPGGCLLLGWVSAPGGWVSVPGGVYFGGGCGIPACTEADIPREQNDKQVQKYYLDHNFVAAGKNVFSKWMRASQI